MNISTHPVMSRLLLPVIMAARLMSRHMPVPYIKLRFFHKFKRLPRLNPPIDLNEKILWMKLFSDTSKWTELADKYRVRQYLEKKGLEKYLVRIYGAWDNAGDIDFSSLPDEVIFKANNGDGKGTNLIVRNLSESNHDSLRQIFNKWLTDKHIGELGRGASIQRHEAYGACRRSFAFGGGAIDFNRL